MSPDFHGQSGFWTDLDLGESTLLVAVAGDFEPISRLQRLLGWRGSIAISCVVHPESGAGMFGSNLSLNQFTRGLLAVGSITAAAGLFSAAMAASGNAPASPPGPSSPALSSSAPSSAAPSSSPPASAAAPSSGSSSPTPSYAAGGEMPTHLPPQIVGRVDAVTGGHGLQISPYNRYRVPASTLDVGIRSYTEIDRFSPLDASKLQRGDSVMVQGTAADHVVQAQRITRLIRRVPLAPGVMLADGATMSADTAPAAPAGAGSPTLNPPTDASNAARKKAAAQAEQLVQQGIRRGQLAGEVVSTNPLSIELYDGQVWTVNSQPGVLTLDQLPVPLDSIHPGDTVMVRGSETGPGKYRAAEVDVVPPGVLLQEINRAGGRGARAGAGGAPRRPRAQQTPRYPPGQLPLILRGE